MTADIKPAPFSLTYARFRFTLEAREDAGSDGICFTPVGLYAFVSRLYKMHAPLVYPILIWHKYYM